jgi:hypothetical protein
MEGLRRPTRRAVVALTLEEREEISRGIAAAARTSKQRGS